MSRTRLVAVSSPLLPVPYRLPPEESPVELDARAQAVLAPARGFARASDAQIRRWLTDPATAEVAFARLPWLGQRETQIRADRDFAPARLGPWPDEARVVEVRPLLAPLVAHVTAEAERTGIAWTPLVEALLEVTGPRGHYDDALYDALRAMVQQRVLPWVRAHVDGHPELVLPLLRRPAAELLRSDVIADGAPLSDALLEVLAAFPVGLHAILWKAALTPAQRDHLVADALRAMRDDPPAHRGTTDRVRLLWRLAVSDDTPAGPLTNPAILATMRTMAESGPVEFEEFLPTWVGRFATTADLDALWPRLLRFAPGALAASRQLTAAQAERLLAPRKVPHAVLEGLAGNRQRLRDPAVTAALVRANKVPLVRQATLALQPDHAALPYFARWVECDPDGALRALLNQKTMASIDPAFRRLVPPEVLAPACSAPYATTRERALLALASVGADAPPPVTRRSGRAPRA